jgi:hypothetical protein
MPMSENTIGREPLQIIEIEQPLCSLEYGVSPCTAAIGVTGSIKCFNTSKTCQDLPNYDPEPLLLRFCKPQATQPEGIFCVPSLQSVSTSPTQINVVGGSKSKGPLGVRAELSVSFKDHPYSDVLVDKYRTERGYIATDRGSYWSKWLARNPYYTGYIIRVYDGYVGQALADMGKRTYLIDTFSGPDSNQNVTIKAKDVLKLADNDKAQAPIASTGELIVDYSDTASMDPMRITGGIASEYPAPGKVRINKELFSYTGVSTISETEINLTGITRSISGTEADDQDSGDRVQWCLEYTNIRPDALTNDLLTTYGAVPSGFIPLSDWSAEASVWLEQFRLSALITEPTGVTDLLGEITEQALFYIWWDERDEQIKLRALRPAAGDFVKPIDNFKNILAGTFELNAKPKERISQVWVFFGQRNPVEKLDDEQNYRRVRVRLDGDAESDLQYGERRIRKIYSRWIQTEAVAIQTTVRLLSRFRDTPEYIAFALDAKDRSMWTGDLADVTVDSVVDVTGAPRILRWQVISAEETVSGEVTEYQLQRFEYGAQDKAAFWMVSDAPTYENASESERLTGSFWGDEFGLMPNGDDGYSWQ